MDSFIYYVFLSPKTLRGSQLFVSYPLAALYVSVRTVARKVVQQQSPTDGLDFFALVVVVVVVAARTGQRKKERIRWIDICRDRSTCVQPCRSPTPPRTLGRRDDGDPIHLYSLSLSLPRSRSIALSRKIASRAHYMSSN